jgi:hypothetical protein
VVTGGHQGQYGGGERGHPGCGDHRRLGVLQFRDHRSDLRVVGVAEAGVETLAPPVDGGLRELLRILGPERRRLVDGWCHGTAGMNVAIGMNGNRTDAARHASPPRWAIWSDTRSLAGRHAGANRSRQLWQQVAARPGHLIVVGTASGQ